jgi:hypothetical protein
MNFSKYYAHIVKYIVIIIALPLFVFGYTNQSKISLFFCLLLLLVFFAQDIYELSFLV